MSRPQERSYSNRFCSIHQNPDGSWDAVNEVTGIIAKENVSYEQAREYMQSTYQYYASIEKQAGW